MGYLIYLVIAILCGLIGLVSLPFLQWKPLPDNDNMIENYKTSMLVLFFNVCSAALLLYLLRYISHKYLGRFCRTITGT